MTAQQLITLLQAHPQLLSKPIRIYNPDSTNNDDIEVTIEAGAYILEMRRVVGEDLT